MAASLALPCFFKSITHVPQTTTPTTSTHSTQHHHRYLGRVAVPVSASAHPFVDAAAALLHQDHDADRS
ncbi:hypothetical protein M0R45_029952 [Rubus argutus]|uniref:Uncharacterized protein n=1 Tax=Rubus argutus TaxID=59490 RepID=A0AAW1WA04_RUBAR